MSSLFETICKINIELAEKHRAEIASAADIIKMKGKLNDAFVEYLGDAEEVEYYIDEDGDFARRAKSPERYEAPDYGIPTFRLKSISSYEDYIA